MRLDGPIVDIHVYTLTSLEFAGYQPDRSTDAMVFNVVAQQRRDGRWHGGGIARPPIEDGDFTRTAQGIRALKVYAIPGRGAEMSERLERAMAWLRSSRPITAEDRAFRLLGLAWGGADSATLQRPAKEIVAA